MKPQTCGVEFHNYPPCQKDLVSVLYEKRDGSTGVAQLCERCDGSAVKLSAKRFD